MRPLHRSLAASTAAVAAAVALSACSSTEAAETDGGNTDGPSNVVVTSFAAANTLDDLELEGRVAGLTKSTNLPEALQTYASDEYADVGTLKEVNMSAVAELDPDLVLLGRRTAPMEAEFDKLSDDVRVFNENGTNLLADNRASVLATAEPFGEDAVAAAEDKLDAIDTKAADIKERAANAGTALVIMTSGGKVTSFGPGSSFNLIYNELGFTPATGGDAGATDPHGAPISWEQIAEINPDHVFVVDRDAAIGQEGQAAEALLDNDVFNSTTAAQNGMVHYLNARSWYLVNGGLSIVEDMIDEVGQAIA